MNAANESLARIVFEDLDDARAAQLRAASGGTLADATGLREAVANVLAPLVQVMPDASTAVMMHGTYLVEFSSKTNAELATGAVEFLRRKDGLLQPTTVHAGRFRENATLAGNGAVGAVKAAAAAKVAILLVVHAQLLEMQQTLDTIKLELRELREMHEDEHLSRVTGRLKALRQLRDDLMNSDRSERDVTRFEVALDAAQTEFLQAGEFAARQIERHARAMKSTSVQVRRFRGSTAERIRDDLYLLRHRHAFATQLHLTSLGGRAVVARLRATLTGTPPDVSGLLDEVADAKREADDFEQVVAAKAVEFASKWRSDEYDVGVRKRLARESREARETAVGMLSLMETRVGEVRDGTPAAVRAVVEVGRDGRLKEVHVLQR